MPFPISRESHLMFDAVQTAACLRLVQWAIEEDLGSTGDLTSRAVIPADLIGRAAVVARAPGVLAGMPAARLVFQTINSRLTFEPVTRDGAALEPGMSVARIGGPMRAILEGERIALNFLQRLSGVATQTRR